MNNKLLNEILDTAKRMEKSGTLSVFFENIRGLTRDEKLRHTPPFIAEDYGYKALNDYCLFNALKYTNEAETCMALAKRYSSWVKETYNDYKSREKEIKQPVILKFIKDYEEEHFAGVNGKVGEK